MAFECDMTNEPMCPACGKAMSDAYELFPRGDDEVDTECGWCDAPILVQQYTSVSYTTRLKEVQHG